MFCAPLRTEARDTTALVVVACVFLACTTAPASEPTMSKPTPLPPTNATSPSAAALVSPEQPSNPPATAGVTVTGPVEGDVVISQGQSGGQTAHTINNYGPPKRALSPAVRSKMHDVLRGAPVSCVGFASTQGDLEADDFKTLLMSVFRDAGWDVRDMRTFMFFGSKRGLVVTIPFGAPEGGTPQIVASALAHTGNPVAGNRGDMAKECGVYVQIWSAPQ